VGVLAHLFRWHQVNIPFLRRVSEQRSDQFRGLWAKLNLDSIPDHLLAFVISLAIERFRDDGPADFSVAFVQEELRIDQLQSPGEGLPEFDF
jgi:hypothetical protein